MPDENRRRRNTAPLCRRAALSPLQSWCQRLYCKHEVLLLGPSSARRMAPTCNVHGS